MPLLESAQGRPLEGVEPILTELSEVWGMNFAAACDDVSDAFMDTTNDNVPLVHPVFLAGCVEVVGAFASIYGAGMTKDEIKKNTFLHHFCDMSFKRHFRANEKVRTKIELVRVKQKKSGIYTGTQFKHFDEKGVLVGTGYFGGVVDGMKGADSERATTLEVVPERVDFSEVSFTKSILFTLSPAAAHVWDACIRNPRVPKAKSSDINVHTNVGLAKKAGLRARTMNGLSLLAKVVSRLLAIYFGEPERIKRIWCMFSAPVFLEQEDVHVEVRFGTLTTTSELTVVFEVVLLQEGTTVLKNGGIVFDKIHAKL